MNHPSPSQSSDNYILAEQVRRSFADAQASNVALGVVAAAMGVALWDLIPHRIFLSWLALAFLVATTWSLVATRYQQDPDHDVHLQYWYRRSLGAAIAVGFVWLLVPLLFIPALSGDYRAFIIVIIVSRTAAAVTAFSTLLPAIWVSVLPTPIVLAGMLLWQQDTTSLWLAFLVGLFVVLTLRSATALNQAIVSSLRLQFSLRSEKEKADFLNYDLMQKINERRLTEGQLRTGMQILTDSTDQIMRSLAQLLTSTSQTATAVTQTAVTVDEVKQTSYVAGQKAKDISEDAQQTASVSKTGAQATESALSGLQRAREEIESIAQSVVKLGEYNNTIGVIVEAVNTLAEQSNLLSVNAAIEAAKAGEHGKGFSVVAHEVKNLAQQSKQATARVKGILQEIQRASHSAMLVTEQGTQAIEVGVSRSIEAHQSIRELSQTMDRAAQAVTQIALSSQEQLVGMDQVAHAMENIKHAATQNVEGMRQIEKAAQRLHEVGQTLMRLVEQFAGEESDTGRS